MPEITWYGHSNFKIESLGKSILIDPFFSSNPKAPLSYEKIEELDLILVSHDHADHLGDTLAIAKKTGASVVAIFELANHLMEEGLKEEQAIGMNIGGHVEIEGIKVHMTPAIHSATYGRPVGFLIELPCGFRLYHAGDTALFSDMALIPGGKELDLALLPIDGRYNMNPEDAARACGLLKARRVIAMHWGTFPVLEQSTLGFENALKKEAVNSEFISLEAGKSYIL